MCTTVRTVKKIIKLQVKHNYKQLLLHKTETELDRITQEYII